MRLRLLVLLFGGVLLIGCSGNRTTPEPTNMAEQAEHAVLVYLKLSDDEFGEYEEREAAYEVEEALDAAVASGDAGEYDGHEFGGGYATLYLYGPDADRLAATVLDVLREREVPPGSFVVKRYGEPGEQEERIDL